MDDTIGWTVFGVACLVMMCVFGSQIKSCNDHDNAAATVQNEQKQRTAQYCIASQRTASDCALILHGTGSR